MSRDNIILIPYGDDPLALLAQHVIEDFSASLPDLTQATILLSEAHAAKRFRQLLLQQAAQHDHHALLCPRILNLRDWAKLQLSKFQKHPQAICGQHQRELILFDALTQHRDLLGNGSPWHLSDDLLKLFDQLTLNQKSLADDYESFEQEVAAAYGLAVEEFPAMGREAKLVYTLWNAWHTQLNAEEVLDSEAAYLLGLNADIENNNNVLYIAGYHQFTLAEQNWLTQLIQKNRCQLYLHGQNMTYENTEPGTASHEYHPDTPVSQLLKIFNQQAENKVENNYAQFINTCYENKSHPFIERAKKLAGIHPDEINKRLKLLFCQGHEQQAHAVELQVRRWLLAGKNNIGIVTENRRLARRVRALLERANVPLQDLAGWALSTTRAGAVIERWLECIEEDFSHLPMLDLLKSPFVFKNIEPSKIKQATYRLEHDIVRQENIARNLQRYKKAIHSREDKLQWSAEVNDTVIEILQTFEAANAMLHPLLNGQHNALDFINTLSASLELIGSTPLLQADAAGSRIIEMLDTLKHSATKYSLNFGWSDFRTWLGRSLEQFVFSPDQSSSPVTLMGLGQSRLQQFDALIIASAEHEHLPGKTSLTPFFNNAVRQQLKLNTTYELLTERFHHFRRLLESSPEILITANDEENGEEVPLSPWLEIIDRLYKQSYAQSLEDNELKRLVSQAETFVIRCSDKTLPDKSAQTRPSLPKELVPTSYSPSSYQQLMNCPYQFFAARGLNLSPSEEVQEALSKSDYGERVHRCLEAFHQNIEWLPGPFNEVLSVKTRDAAIACLDDIAQQVFARDVEDNFEHSGWLEQWRKLIPAYIDWQLSNATEWRFLEAEHKSKINWINNLQLSGRLDRLDNNDSGLSVIDYKTGQSASQVEIQQGEAVQLPFYAILAAAEFSKPVSKVSYLELSSKVKTAAQLADEELETISEKISERLSLVTEQMLAGKPLPAWGTDSTCQYCNMDRLCRKQAWTN